MCIVMVFSLLRVAALATRNVTERLAARTVNPGSFRRASEPPEQVGTAVVSLGGVNTYAASWSAASGGGVAARWRTSVRHFQSL